METREYYYIKNDVMFITIRKNYILIYCPNKTPPLKLNIKQSNIICYWNTMRYLYDIDKQINEFIDYKLEIQLRDEMLSIPYKYIICDNRIMNYETFCLHINSIT